MLARPANVAGMHPTGIRSSRGGPGEVNSRSHPGKRRPHRSRRRPLSGTVQATSPTAATGGGKAPRRNPAAPAHSTSTERRAGGRALKASASGGNSGVDPTDSAHRAAT